MKINVLVTEYSFKNFHERYISYKPMHVAIREKRFLKASIYTKFVYSIIIRAT